MSCIACNSIRATLVYRLGVILGAQQGAYIDNVILTVERADSQEVSPEHAVHIYTLTKEEYFYYFKTDIDTLLPESTLKSLISFKKGPLDNA